MDEAHSNREITLRGKEPHKLNEHDRTLVAEMMRLSVEERLVLHERMRRTIIELRQGFAAATKSSHE